MSAAQVDEWAYFERRYGPILVHERIDIGLAGVIQMLSQSNKPLSEFLPSWWDWIEEHEEEVDEAGHMIATMRAMAAGWKRKREGEVNDGGERIGSPDHRRRDEPEARVYSGDGSYRTVRGGGEDVVGGDEAS